jgi:hypothetical protein
MIKLKTNKTLKKPRKKIRNDKNWTRKNIIRQIIIEGLNWKQTKFLYNYQEKK